MIFAVIDFLFNERLLYTLGAGVENRRFPHQKHDSPKRAIDEFWLPSILVVYAVQRYCTDGFFSGRVFRI